MSNEKKVQESATTESNVEAKKEKLIEVKREMFGTSEKDGKPLYSYYLDITLLGGPLRVSLLGKDDGNFRLLDLIYQSKDVANGRIKVSSFMPEKSKTPIETVEVEVFVLDEDGDEICASLFPQRNSDKKCLENYLKKLKRAN